MKRSIFTLFIFLLLSESVFAGLVAEKVVQLKSNLDQPSDIAVRDDGRVYVLDGVNNRIVVFTPNGEKDFIFGTGESVLKRPMGIAIADGKVYIADSGQHRIVVFNLRGEFIKALPLAGELPPEPVALTVADGIATWSDRRNHRVCRSDINTDETLLCWGKRGDGEGDFQFPFQLKSDRDGYIYVVDVLNGRVQVFNHQGRYFNQIGRFGLEPGELYRPNGLAFYDDDYLLVSDAYRGTVSVFQNGRSVGLLRDDHGEALRFATPVGLTIRHDRLYVADMMMNNIEVFRLRQNKDQALSIDRKHDVSQKNCSICHLAWAPDYSVGEGEQDGVPPVATERMCYSCHHGAVLDSRSTIGRGEQHPDIHHQRKKEKNKQAVVNREDKIPRIFPLLDSKKKLRGKKEVLSCGSCHTPHTPDIDKADTLYSQHENPWLRVLNHDGDLCQKCHESKLDNVQDIKKSVSGVNHPIGIYLKTPLENETKNYATSKKLHKGLPKALAENGATLGHDRQMLCQSCHQIHGATNEALTPLDYNDGQLCAECHERQYAENEKEARKKGIHPVNIELEEPVKVGDKEVKKITCLTCHSVHEGEKGSAVLKFDDKEGKLCSYCHKEYDAVVNSDHDLRVTAEKYKNRFKHTPAKSGACGTCHTMHAGKPDVPFLYAGEYSPYTGEETALERDRICLDCHRKKGSAEKVIVEHFSHPAKDLVLRSDPKVMPLLNAKNEIEQFGAIACITCHEPHRWAPKEEQKNKTPRLAEQSLLLAKNQDGNVLNSFLRRKGAKGTFCVNCHGLETRIKYKYYHDELAREKEIDYLK